MPADVNELRELRRGCMFDRCSYAARITDVSADGKWRTWICANPTEVHRHVSCADKTRRCDAQKGAQ